MKAFWDERYKQKEFAYGETPNAFFRAQIAQLAQGRILFPAEGEGRNAVYAATLGWQVEAFDISYEGKKKAEMLAAKQQVSINYHVGELQNLNFSPAQFDAIALIYAHFPSQIRTAFHHQLIEKLKPGGLVILEAFSKSNIAYRAKNPEVGGPDKVDMLYSVEDLQADFKNFDIITREEKEIELHEGAYHNGLASVVRFVGVKQ